jgi:hypothetical protein
MKQINEIKRMQQLAGVINEIETNYPTLLEVIKDGYFCFDIEGISEGEFYTKEEINIFSNPFIVGDVWELVKDTYNEYNGDFYYKCTKGKREGDERGIDFLDMNNNKIKRFFKILKR